MDDLSKALGDITSIRRQLADATEFRGYGPATVAATGLLAVGGAMVQTVWLPVPAGHSFAYLALWTAVAAVSAGLTAVQVRTRTRRLHSGLSQQMLRTAMEQFLPSLLAGALVSAVIAFCVPGVLWLLPALWSILFSLGIFASCRFLPRAMLAAGAWYLAAGLLLLALGDARTLGPWNMALAFGAGEFLVAIILLCCSEEGSHGRR